MHNVTAEDSFEETQQDIGSWTACGKLTFIESKTVCQGKIITTSPLLTYILTEKGLYK